VSPKDYKPEVKASMFSAKEKRAAAAATPPAPTFEGTRAAAAALSNEALLQQQQLSRSCDKYEVLLQRMRQLEEEKENLVRRCLQLEEQQEKLKPTLADQRTAEASLNLLVDVHDMAGMLTAVRKNAADRCVKVAPVHEKSAQKDKKGAAKKKAALQHSMCPNHRALRRTIFPADSAAGAAAPTS
jgi:hypothetical protein